MILFNYNNDEIVSSPTVIVSGTTDANQGYIEFINNENSVFPPCYFEVNNHQFKALVHVSQGTNKFKVTVYSGGLDPLGFPHGGSVIESKDLQLQLFPLSNKPVHLCVILGRDSQGGYDMPRYKSSNPANLDTAIRKLKVAGRIMQAYTQDEMRQSGFSNRSFQFVEEPNHHQDVFGYGVESKIPHAEIKIHVLRSPKTVAEIRDPNYAQQNSKGSDTGWLFSHALEVIRNSELFAKRGETALQCAVMYLDAHYDVKRDLILAHAALGGGNADIKLAIFGSHGMHSWPQNFANVTPSFLDATHLSKNEVANDANQCGTSWECLNITMGAFMHEIGHSLGCPHQVDGVMLRDYIWWNRSFMTRETECLRSHTSGAVIGARGWDKVCHWNILDKIRFLYHGSFALPIDQAGDHTFTTTPVPDRQYGDKNKAPVGYNIGDGKMSVISDAGIFLVEVITKDLARYHVPCLSKNHGGQGFQTQMTLDYRQLYQQLQKSTKEVSENFNVRVLSLGGDFFIEDFKKQSTGNVIEGDFGLNRGRIRGYRSVMLGSSKGPEKVIGFDLRGIYKVRVYHGGALDGVKFYFRSGPPPVPSRNYMKKMVSKINDTAPGETSVLLGNEKSHYTDVNVNSNNPIVKFHFRNGQWIDAIQMEFANGEKSAMLGNANGGHLSTLEAPQGCEMIGMYGYTGNWLDGVGIVYSA